MRSYEFVRISHLVKYVRIAVRSGWKYKIICDILFEHISVIICEYKIIVPIFQFTYNNKWNLNSEPNVNDLKYSFKQNTNDFYICDM